MDVICSTFTAFAELVEEQCEDVERWKIILSAVALTSGYLWLRRFLRETEDLVAYAKKKSFSMLRKLPPVQRMIAKELDDARIAIEEELITSEERKLKKFHQIPEKGMSPEKVIELSSEAITLGQFDWKDGKVSGGIFAGADQEYTNFMIRMYKLSSWTNPLHADLFPGVTKMEAEIVRMTIELFHGDKNVVGTMTSGGTESLIMMMKAYRNWGRHTRGIKRPEVLVPHTIHAAIDKGAEILGFARIRKLPVDPKTMTVKPSDFRRNINSNTVLIVVSAPEFAYGSIDDIKAIASMAQRKGIPIHVDCCLGGFILPFMEQAGFPLPPFDFRVPGVTSISADTHKYGRVPKGTSVIMYKSSEFAHHQYFAVPDWPGGIYASPAIQGSRSGSNIAMCWAGMLHHGIEGYVEVTRKIITVARYLKKEYSTIPGIFVYGDPIASVVAIGSNELNIYQVGDVMAGKGWHLQPLQKPSGLHIFLTELHTKEGLAQTLIKDMRASVKEVQAASSDASIGGLARLYGMAHSIPDKSLIKEATDVYNDVYYSTPE